MRTHAYKLQLFHGTIITESQYNLAPVLGMKVKQGKSVIWLFLHGEEDFVASAERFVNKATANQNSCGDNFNCYNNNMNCHNHNYDNNCNK